MGVVQSAVRESGAPRSPLLNGGAGCARNRFVAETGPAITRATPKGEKTMPRVLVTTDDSTRRVLMDERVGVEHLDTDHSAEQLIERLAWSITEASEAEAAFRDAVRPRSYREVAN